MITRSQARLEPVLQPRLLGRFNVRKACDSQMSKTTRAVKRRERRAPTVWLRFRFFYFGIWVYTSDCAVMNLG
jgi:hypothetical protein